MCIEEIANRIKENSKFYINLEWDFDEFFVGPTGKVPFETRWQARESVRHGTVTEKEQIVYIRVGERIFLDDRLKKNNGIHSHSNIIYLSKFESSLKVLSLHDMLA